MRTPTLLLCASLVLAASGVRADVTVKGQGSDVTVGQAPGGVTIQQGAPGNTPSAIQWTMLQGEVASIDQQTRMVTMKLKGSDSVVSIPADPATVAIYKHGDHRYDLRDINTGDDITLRRTQ